MTSQVSPELKALIKQWTDMQKEKYGPNWKEILAKEMSSQMVSTGVAPYFNFLLKNSKKD